MYFLVESDETTKHLFIAANITNKRFVFCSHLVFQPCEYFLVNLTLCET